MPLQSAAIPFRLTAAGELDVLLVTSRRKAGWVCPKGKMKAGYSASLSAAVEAFEEGGILGTIAPTAIATYEKTRSRDGEELVIPMQVFPLLVETETSHWAVMHQRTRR